MDVVASWCQLNHLNVHNTLPNEILSRFIAFMLHLIEAAHGKFPARRARFYCSEAHFSDVKYIEIYRSSVPVWVWARAYVFQLFSDRSMHFRTMWLMHRCTNCIIDRKPPFHWIFWGFLSIYCRESSVGDNARLRVLWEIFRTAALKTRRPETHDRQLPCAFRRDWHLFWTRNEAVQDLYSAFIHNRSVDRKQLRCKQN